ncbi:MAG TPA: Rid family hydrolase, partial [Solirubrobacteraceae bacterium]|nr:Rid family hydrolase [Solirubrobacteraceae bacterium]
MSANRQQVNAADAPEAIGPYVHAIRTGDLLFCSGQIPIDPRTGELVAGTVADQTGRCLENLAAVCAAAGTSLGDAVRLTVYTTE